jgi:hypothetical protein
VAEQQIYIGGKPKKKVGKKRPESRLKEKRELKTLREKNEELNEKRMLKRV